MINRGSFATRLSYKILIANLLIVITALGTITALAYKNLEKNAVENAKKLLEATAEDVQSVLTKTEVATESLIWVAKEHVGDPDYYLDFTKNFVNQHELIIGARIAFEPNFFPSKGEYYCVSAHWNDTESELISEVLGGPDYDYFIMDWYQIPQLLSKNMWIEPYFDKGATGKTISTYAVPLWDEEGHVFAVLTADISLSDTQKMITSIKPYKNSYAFLLGASGRFLSHPDQTKSMSYTIFTGAYELNDNKLLGMAKDMVAGKGGVLDYKTPRGERSFITYGPLNNGWSLGILCLDKDVFAQLHYFFWSLVAFSLLCMFILYQVTRKVIRRATQPITEFAYAAMNIGKGNFKATIPEVTTKDELLQLHDALSYMLESVTTYMRKLKTTTLKKQRIENELNIASDIQRQMLEVNFPKNELLDIYAHLQPAKEVGGDLYDFVVRGKNLYFVIGDVSGKGIPAAMYMTITRSAFRFIAGLGRSLSDMAGAINNAFAEGNSNEMFFVTLFLGKVDLETYEMEYCNAGHNPIIIAGPDGKPEYLHSKPNLAAGLFQDFPYQSETMQLAKGSRILLYTDGVTEAETHNKDQYGEDRLLEFVASQSAAESSRDFVDSLVKSVSDFVEGNEPNDDVTIMSIKF